MRDKAQQYTGELLESMKTLRQGNKAAEWDQRQVERQITRLNAIRRPNVRAGKLRSGARTRSVRGLRHHQSVRLMDLSVFWLGRKAKSARFREYVNHSKVSAVVQSAVTIAYGRKSVLVSPRKPNRH
jgi:hypothetical protein